jgi:hypothetical protein
MTANPFGNPADSPFIVLTTAAKRIGKRSALKFVSVYTIIFRKTTGGH